MNWICKSVAYRVLSALPGVRRTRYFLQRFVTGALPSSEAQLSVAVSQARRHVELMREHLDTPLSEAVLYEFGAGVDLISSLVFAGCGVRRQIVVDVEQLVRCELVLRAVDFLQSAGMNVAAVRQPQARPRGDVECFEWLKEHCGIIYKAPCNPSSTDIGTATIDCVTSINTMEHIPPADLRTLLLECRRILRPGGMMLSLIDYQDHYSYCDSRLSAYHFLRFSDPVWRVLNPELHYQNRMRHPEYLGMFADAGFRMVAESRLGANNEDLLELRKLKLASRFRSFAPSDLAIRGALLAARS